VPASDLSLTIEYKDPLGIITQIFPDYTAPSGVLRQAVSLGEAHTMGVAKVASFDHPRPLGPGMVSTGLYWAERDQIALHILSRCGGGAAMADEMRILDSIFKIHDGAGRLQFSRLNAASGAVESYIDAYRKDALAFTSGGGAEGPVGTLKGGVLLTTLRFQANYPHFRDQNPTLVSVSYVSGPAVAQAIDYDGAIETGVKVSILGTGTRAIVINTTTGRGWTIDTALSAVTETVVDWYGTSPQIATAYQGSTDLMGSLGVAAWLKLAPGRINNLEFWSDAAASFDVEYWAANNTI